MPSSRGTGGGGGGVVSQKRQKTTDNYFIFVPKKAKYDRNAVGCRYANKSLISTVAFWFLTNNTSLASETKATEKLERKKRDSLLNHDGKIQEQAEGGAKEKRGREK